METQTEKTTQEDIKKKREKLIKEFEKLGIDIFLVNNGWGELWFNGYNKNGRNYRIPSKLIISKLKDLNIKGLR